MGRMVAERKIFTGRSAVVGLYTLVKGPSRLATAHTGPSELFCGTSPTSLEQQRLPRNFAYFGYPRVGLRARIRGDGRIASGWRWFAVSLSTKKCPGGRRNNTRSLVQYFERYNGHALQPQEFPTFKTAKFE